MRVAEVQSWTLQGQEQSPQEGLPQEWALRKWPGCDAA